MTRNRIIALSSIVLIASGGLIFACSGDDNGFNDGGSDAKADQTSNKDSGSDAGKDGSPFSDAGKDATVQDSGNDATLQDGATDATENDAATDAAADSSDDAAVTDASTDGGTVATFMVVRVGGDVDAGADAALTTTSTQVFVEERNISDGSLVKTIAMPTAVNGNNQPLTMSGSASSEGSLTRSADGHYVVLGGFGAGPGVASIAKTSVDGGALRVVARIDSSGNVDTTTQLAAFDTADFRGAASNDGTSFWTSGAGNVGEGTPYVAYASTGAVTDLSTTPTNTRVVQVFGGQVYVSTSSGAFHGVSMVGTGLPTTTGQTTTLLPGMPVDAGSAYGFAMLDDDASVNGLDVLYIADDGAGGSTMPGINKWVFNGTTWTKIATFTNGSSGAFRGVTAYIDGANIVVLGTDTSSNVVKYADDGNNTNPTGTVLATAPTNTAYRGIAISPQ